MEGLKNYNTSLPKNMDLGLFLFTSQHWKPSSCSNWTFRDGFWKYWMDHGIFFSWLLLCTTSWFRSKNLCSKIFIYKRCVKYNASTNTWSCCIVCHHSSRFYGSSTIATWNTDLASRFDEAETGFWKRWTRGWCKAVAATVPLAVNLQDGRLENYLDSDVRFTSEQSVMLNVILIYIYIYKYIDSWCTYSDLLRYHDNMFHL